MVIATLSGGLPLESALLSVLFRVVIAEPDPGTRAVFEKAGATGETMLFQGDASANMYTCGSCASSLVFGAELSQLQGLVLKCAGCGAFNETVARQEPAH
jgi:hypothetical protein